jgi:hypothetical protein
MVDTSQAEGIGCEWLCGSIPQPVVFQPTVGDSIARLTPFSTDGFVAENRHETARKWLIFVAIFA